VAGPWEKYAGQTSSKPWEKYGAPAMANETPEGVVMRGPDANVPSYLRNDLGGAAGVARKITDAGLKATTFGLVDADTVSSVAGGLNQLGEGMTQLVSHAAGAERGSRIRKEAGENIRGIQRGLDDKGWQGAVGGFVGRNALGLTGNVVAAGLGGLAAPDDSGESSMRQRVGQGALEAGVTAVAPIVVGRAVNWLRGAPKATTGSGERVIGSGVSEADAAQDVRNILTKEHASVAAKEKAAWEAVRAEAAQQSIPYTRIGQLQEALMGAQAGAGAGGQAVIDGQLRALNRFVDGGLDVPAQQVVAMRQALSRASARDGGLREAVKAMDEILGETLNVRSLPKALSASRNRFGLFDEQKAVADAIADGTSVERVGEILFKGNAQASEVFDQVLRAAGPRAAEAEIAMQRGIVRHVLNDGVISYARKGGEPIINKQALSDNVFKLRDRNRSLWIKLTTGQRESLLRMAEGLKKSADGNVLSRNLGRVMDMFGPKVAVVNRLTGATEQLSPRQTMNISDAIKMLDEPIRRVAQPLSGGGKTAAGIAGGAGAGLVNEPNQGEDKKQDRGGQPRGMTKSPEVFTTTPKDRQVNAGDISPTFVAKVVQAESSGNRFARPIDRKTGKLLSSAYGHGQITSGTWLGLVEKHKPEWAKGLSKGELLKLRADPEKAAWGVETYARDNAAVLRKAGAPVNDATLYLAHFLDGRVAAKVLTAKPNQPVSRFVSRGAIEANKSVLAGKKVEDVIRWAQRKMQG
jgi:hypothetical protein